MSWVVLTQLYPDEYRVTVVEPRSRIIVRDFTEGELTSTQKDEKVTVTKEIITSVETKSFVYLVLVVESIRSHEHTYIREIFILFYKRV